MHVGGSGQAVSMKIAINLCLAPQLIALFEGVLLAERSGIPRASALDALLNSVASSPAMKYRAPFILNWPDSVFIDGKPMKRNGKLLDVDLERISRMAHQSRDAVVAKSGFKMPTLQAAI